VPSSRQPQQNPGPAPIPEWVPEDARRRLDLSELWSGDVLALHERDRLERVLGQHVAAYRRSARGCAHGLCSVYVSADLSAPDLAHLTEAEQRFSEVVFVAYARPLRTRPADPPTTLP
jgi:hypothetical protein